MHSEKLFELLNDEDVNDGETPVIVFDPFNCIRFEIVKNADNVIAMMMNNAKEAADFLGENMEKINEYGLNVLTADTEHFRFDMGEDFEDAKKNLQEKFDQVENLIYY